MRKLLMVLMLTSTTGCIGTLLNPGLSKLDAEYGFRDLKLGTARASIPGLVKPNPSAIWWERSAENLAVGGVPLRRIECMFDDAGRLFLITLVPAGEYGAALDALVGLYGFPNFDDDEPTWYGGRVMLILKEDGKVALYERDLLQAHAATLGPTCGPGEHYVSGYTRKNGTHVNGYCR